MLLPLPNDSSFMMSIQGSPDSDSLHLNGSSTEQAPKNEQISKEETSSEDTGSGKILNQNEILLKISEISQAIQSNLIQASNNGTLLKEIEELNRMTQEMGHLLVDSRPRYG